LKRNASAREAEIYGLRRVFSAMAVDIRAYNTFVPCGALQKQLIRLHDSELLVIVDLIDLSLRSAEPTSQNLPKIGKSVIRSRPVSIPSASPLPIGERH
jgi:hypothetical protein